MRAFNIELILGLGILVIFTYADLFARNDNHGHALKTHDFKAIKDEPAARDLLKQTYDNQHAWPHTFPGFTAKVIFFENDRIETGEVNVAANGDVQVSITDDAAQKWLSLTLHSIAQQMRQSSFAEGYGRCLLTLGAEDDHPLGRLVFVHGDGMNTSYRIKDGQIRQVNKKTQDHQLTIDVFENSQTGEGKFLPRHFVISTYAKKSGELLKREECLDWYVKVGVFYLPHARKVVISEKEERTVRSMKLFHFKLQNQPFHKHPKQSTDKADVSGTVRIFRDNSRINNATDAPSATFGRNQIIDSATD